MIDLLEGIPGSGKSYEAVVYHVLPSLQEGRKVITNLPLNVEAFARLDPDFKDLIEIRKKPKPIFGRWEAEAADRGESCFIVGDFSSKKGGMNVIPDQSEFFDIDGFPALLPADNVRPFGHVWDFYDTWRGKGNVGPLYVIDECHNSFPKTNVLKRRHTPEDVIQWFKLHRHFGADVLLMTQRMGSLDDDISGLAQFHIRVHKASFLGKKDSYIRKVFAGYRGGEVQRNERKYKPQYFLLSLSHTQGSTVIESDAKDLKTTYVKLNKFKKYYFVFAAFFVIYAIYANFGSKEEKKKSVPADAPVVRNEPLPASLQEHVPPALPNEESAPTVTQEASDGPLKGKTLHLTGWLNMPSKGIVYTLAVSVSGRVIFETDSIQLEKAGYSFHLAAECIAFVSWKGKDQVVVCDVPRIQQGSNERPVVVDAGAKRANQISAAAAVPPASPKNL